MKKKVWKVHLSVIEQSYHGRSHTIMGRADNLEEASRLAKKTQEGNPGPRSVIVNSVEYIGSLQF